MLEAEADRMAPVRLPEDLWQRGRRRHRRRIAAGVAVALAVALALPGMTVLSGRPPAMVAAADAAVPGTVFDPWPWQAPVAQAPAGPAAMLVSGSGSGLGAVDLPGAYGSKIAAVGRDGSYRMLRYAETYQQAGQDVRLSPDGRYVAGPDSAEDLIGLDDTAGRLSVVDLVTGQDRRFTGLPADVPVAWRPDGAALLLWDPPQAPRPLGDSPPFDGNEAAYGYAGGTLWLLDLATGTSSRVIDLGTAVFDPISSVAFAPDGRHVAVQRDRTLLLVDLAGTGTRTLATLDAGQRLAGTGAFTGDGTRIAVLGLDGCAVSCTHAARNQRQWRLTTVDVATGRPAADGGFARIGGAAVRVAGWQDDGTAVVVAYEDTDEPPYDQGPAMDAPAAYRAVSAAGLFALRPDGSTTPLIRTQGVQVWDIDVARDLLAGGRFGGPSPEPAAFPAAWWIYGFVLIPVAGLLLLTALVVRLRRGARRRRAAGRIG
jgi:hypothetical protein